MFRPKSNIFGRCNCDHTRTHTSIIYLRSIFAHTNVLFSVDQKRSSLLLYGRKSIQQSFEGGAMVWAPDQIRSSACLVLILKLTEKVLLAANVCVCLPVSRFGL
jgi:hypothetical protein